MAKKLPLAPLAKILKESSPNMRISRQAAEEFSDVIGDIARDMAKDAAEFASHAKRKTIVKEDISLLRKMRK
jgi:histone H3/H4